MPQTVPPNRKLEIAKAQLKKHRVEGLQYAQNPELNRKPRRGHYGGSSSSTAPPPVKLPTSFASAESDVPRVGSVEIDQNGDVAQPSLYDIPGLGDVLRQGDTLRQNLQTRNDTDEPWIDREKCTLGGSSDVRSNSNSKQDRVDAGCKSSQLESAVAEVPALRKLDDSDEPLHVIEPVSRVCGSADLDVGIDVDMDIDRANGNDGDELRERNTLAAKQFLQKISASPDPLPLESDTAPVERGDSILPDSKSEPECKPTPRNFRVKNNPAASLLTQKLASQAHGHLHRSAKSMKPRSRRSRQSDASSSFDHLDEFKKYKNQDQFDRRQDRGNDLERSNSSSELSSNALAHLGLAGIDTAKIDVEQKIADQHFWVHPDMRFLDRIRVI